MQRSIGSPVLAAILAVGFVQGVVACGESAPGEGAESPGALLEAGREDALDGRTDIAGFARLIRKEERPMLTLLLNMGISRKFVSAAMVPRRLRSSGESEKIDEAREKWEAIRRKYGLNRSLPVGIVAKLACPWSSPRAGPTCRNSSPT